MTNYISLKSILAFIPKPLLEQSDESDFLSWALLGLRETKIVTMYEPKVQIFELSNGTVQLPSDIKEINLVSYLAHDPKEDEIQSLTDCSTPCNTGCEDNQTMSNPSDTNNICNYTMAYKMFIDSPYYNNNFIPLQYRGNGAYICKNCPNKTTPCQHIYTVDHNKTLHTDLKEGFVCVDYDTEIIGSDGNLLIPDFPELRQFLVFYCVAKHWEERAMTSEQNAGRMSQDYLVRAEIYLNKVKGMSKLRNIDANSIALLQGGQYQKLIKVPGRYVYSR